MNTRIYAIKPIGAIGPVTLVRSVSKAGALRYVAERTLEANIATQEELVKAVSQGTEVVDAKPEQQDLTDSDD